MSAPSADRNSFAGALQPTGAVEPASALEPTVEFDAASLDALAERFLILRPHALGGVGEVLVALDRELHREVALKRIQEQFADDPHAQSRFAFEAEITGGLEHPGIVPVYGMGRQANGQLYYAMRFVRGASLKDAIEEFHAAEREDGNPAERALALRKLLRRFLDVCNTVHYAHSRGVLHRDLKPSNVMLGEFGETLLVDWGLAKLIDAQDHRRGDEPLDEPLRPFSAEARLPTQLGKAAGTPAYMSPEQVAGAARLTPASDVYSLGATLYTLLVGRPPFDLENDPDVRQAMSAFSAEKKRAPTSEERWRTALPIVLGKVRRGAFPEPREVNPRTPTALEAICLRAMAREPASRFESARALGDQIERWLSEEPLAAWVAAVDYFQDLCGQHPKVVSYREGLARNRISLALVQSGMQRPADAEATLRAVMDDYQQLIEAHDDALPYEVELAQVRLLLSRVLVSRGNRVAAETERRAAESAMVRLLQSGAGTRQYPSNLASVLLTLGHSPADVMSRLAADGAGAGARDETDALDTAHYSPPSKDSSREAIEAAPAGGERASDSTIGHPLTETRQPSAQGDVQARYELLRRLASGGLSSLWLARDLDLKRDVVLKELNDARRPETRKMFLREARVTSLLDHPSIPTVYGVGYRTHDDAPFFTMRWLAGQTMLTALRKLHEGAAGQPFPVERLARLLAALEDVCDALAYAHRRGVIHRDPKPSNIVIEPNGRGVLIDWGLTRLVEVGDRDVSHRDAPPPDFSPEEAMLGDEADRALRPIMELIGVDDQPLDSFGQVIGTPAYMAPEQALGDIDRIGPRSDIFAIGATLFHILTGHVPFEGNIEATLGRRIRGETPAPKAKNPAIPLKLDAICRRAMAHDPAERYPSAAILAQELRDWRRLAAGLDP